MPRSGFLSCDHAPVSSCRVTQNMKNALAPGGVISTQGECLWLHLKLIKTVLHACAEVFATVDYAFTTVPSYPSGQIGFILASNVERGEMFLLRMNFSALTRWLAVNSWKSGRLHCSINNRTVRSAPAL